MASVSDPIIIEDGDDSIVCEEECDGGWGISDDDIARLTNNRLLNDKVNINSTVKKKLKISSDLHNKNLSVVLLHQSIHETLNIIWENEGTHLNSYTFCQENLRLLDL